MKVNDATNNALFKGADYDETLRYIQQGIWWGFDVMFITKAVMKDAKMLTFAPSPYHCSGPSRIVDEVRHLYSKYGMHTYNTYKQSLSNIRKE